MPSIASYNDVAGAVAARDDAHSADLNQYASGLTGVNVIVDNVSSRILYGTAGLIALLILLVCTGHWFNSQLRMITTIHSTPEQQNFWRYNHGFWWPWLKRHLIYAPLNKKRHNREIQLSSAYNVGTIPGRRDTIILTVYILSNLIFCLMLDYQDRQMEAAIAEFRGRTGHLSALNLILLFILAGRNNPLIYILGVPFDTMNLFHRWIGRTTAVEAIAHTIAWAVNKHTAMGWEGLWSALNRDPFLQYGTLSSVALFWIFFLAPSMIRHAFYETFLLLHRLLALTTLVGVIAHCQLGPLPQLGFVIFTWCIWWLDHTVRIIRVLVRNVSFTRGVTRVTIQALPSEACRVTFHIPNQWTPPPGAHVYAYLPYVSYWQSHPFSVAWSENVSKHERKPSNVDEKMVAYTPPNYASRVSLVMAARTGMTRKLYNRAKAQPDGVYQTVGFLEGPYGALESLHSYGTVLLFAGGVGITHMMPIIRDLLKRRAERTASCRRVVLVWSIRDRVMLEWIRPWMEEILRMEERRDVLQIKIFVTRPKNPNEVVSPSTRVQMLPGRPKIESTVWEVFDNRIGAMCIGVCGPGALADDVRGASRGVVQEGKVDFWEEAFTW